MKISNYTFLFKGSEGEFYIYNSLSNALISIEEGVYNIIEKCKKDKTNIEVELLGSEMVELLENKRFVVENEKDELLAYKAIINNLRNKDNYVHLTVAPTMDCNFRCHYCFEQNITKTYIDDNVIDALIKNILNRRNLDSLFLTWFGGEPLMALPQMKMIYDKLMTFWGDRTFESNIITTAYFIDKQAIQTLKDIRVTNMQITLDGLKESHNKIKFTENCNDVFSKIIKNVDLLVAEYPELRITFRVNLTKQNISEYIPLYKFLTEHYAGNNIGVVPAFVMDRTNKNEDKKLFFSNKESSEIILALMWKHNIHSPAIRYPERMFYECAIRNINTMNIDPEGYVYKCWEIIGNKKYAVGKLDTNGDIADTNYTQLNRQLFGADPLSDKTCTQCSYLPVCNGGCPIHRIQNEFEGWHNNTCTLWKGYLPQFLLTHLALKKAGFENH
jgi:uncharacterized protein